MLVDEIFLLYENSGKYFKSYDDAYYNSKKAGQDHDQILYEF